MFSKMSKVKSLSLKTLAFSSTMQIGDCSYIDGLALVLATQRKSDTFSGKEGNFNDFTIFNNPFIIPRVNEPIQCCFSNPNPFIRVGNVEVIGVSSSAVVGVGNVGHIRMQSRTKHIRQIIREPEEPPTGETTNEV